MRDKDFFELIRRAIDGSGKSIEEIARGREFSAVYLRKVAKGYVVPGDTIVIRMADALALDRRALLGAARKAKGKPLESIESLLPPPKEPKTLPSFGHIVAGDPAESVAESEGEYQVLPEQWGESRYILAVSGDSMYPELKNGDRVLIENVPDGTDPQRCNGKVCAVLLNGESTLKRVFVTRERGKVSVQLKPDNPYLPACTVKEGDEFRIQGVVIEIVKRKL